MEIVLLTEIENLGGPGDVVKARDGYARNYLIPYGKAKVATPENCAEVEKRKKELQAEVDKARHEANERREKLDGLVIPMEVETKDGVELYGALGVADIVKHINETGKYEVHKNEVIVSDGAIREVGDHAVVVHLHTDISATVTLSIQSKGGEAKAQGEGEEPAQAQETGDAENAADAGAPEAEEG